MMMISNISRRITVVLCIFLMVSCGQRFNNTDQQEDYISTDGVDFQPADVGSGPDIIPDVVSNFLHDLDYPEYLLLDTSRSFNSTDSLAAYKKMVDGHIRAYVADHPDLPAMFRSNLQRVNTYFLQYALFKMIRDKPTDKDSYDFNLLKGLIRNGKGSADINSRYLIEVLESFPENIRNSPEWKEKREVLNVKQLAGLSMMEAPDVALQTRDSQQVHLKDILQVSEDVAYTILVFTASWCAPCHRDYERNKRHFDAVQQNHTRVISYSLDTKLTNWRRLIADDEYIKEVYCDLQGFDSPLARHLEIGGVPQYILLDSDLKIVASYTTGEIQNMFSLLLQ